MIDYLLLLRFGSSTIIDEKHPILNFSSIAKVSSLSVAYVRQLIAKGLSLLSQGKHAVTLKRSKLSQ